jgi:hypothetical protein
VVTKKTTPRGAFLALDSLDPSPATESNGGLAQPELADMCSALA